MKKHNFYAGPSILPQETIKATADAVLNFAGTGLSLLEISHRSKEFDAVNVEAQQLFKELLEIPEGYEVVFLGGGASLQFCMAPFNFLNKKAAYLKTGVWAKKAQKEATLFGEVVEVASSEEKTFCYIPKNFEANVQNIKTEIQVAESKLNDKRQLYKIGVNAQEKQYINSEITDGYINLVQDKLKLINAVEAYNNETKD